MKAKRLSDEKANAEKSKNAGETNRQNAKNLDES
jgi:hypothetical protein